jgi:hypothetical protein
MVRVTPLLSAAFVSLAAGEVVLAESQQHLRDSSTLQDRCALIASSISDASAVYYPCKLYVHPLLSRADQIWPAPLSLYAVYCR